MVGFRARRLLLKALPAAPGGARLRPGPALGRPGGPLGRRRRGERIIALMPDVYIALVLSAQLRLAASFKLDGPLKARPDKFSGRSPADMLAGVRQVPLVP